MKAQSDLVGSRSVFWIELPRSELIAKHIIQSGLGDRFDFKIVRGALEAETVIGVSIGERFLELPPVAALVSKAQRIVEMRADEFPISRTNRFTDASAVENYNPFDPEFANCYLNVDEVCSFVEHMIGRFGAAVHREPLPYKTWECRDVPAVCVSTGGVEAAGMRTCLVLAGMHAREWPSTEAAIGFVDRIAKSSTRSETLRIGSAVIDYAQIARLLDEWRFVVVPCVNLDGVWHAQNVEIDWRRNRRPIGGGAFGVDLNRNFPYLWDDNIRGAVPGSGGYKGPKPLSEPEARNIDWLIEKYEPEALIDVHTAGGFVLHSWGNDPIQSDCPEMNFGNHKYFGLRGGQSNGAYAEFMPSEMLESIRKCGARIRDAMTRATGDIYDLRPAFEVPEGTLGVAHFGLCQDYATSRSLSPGSTAARTLAYTLELGNIDQIVDYNVVAGLLVPNGIMAVLGLAGA